MISVETRVPARNQTRNEREEVEGDAEMTISVMAAIVESCVYVPERIAERRRLNYKIISNQPNEGEIFCSKLMASVGNSQKIRRRYASQCLVTSGSSKYQLICVEATLLSATAITSIAYLKRP